MTTAHVEADTSWSSLAALGETERMGAMIDRFRRVVSKEETERLHDLEAMVRAEYALPETELHEFTRSRLRAWIALQEQDQGQAEALARAYHTVFQRVPADIAMRRTAAVQSVARTDLGPEELTSLDSLIPDILATVVAQRAGPSKATLARPPDTAPVSQPAMAESAPREKKPFWKFW